MAPPNEDARLDALKEEREIDVHRVPLETLYSRFNSSPVGLTQAVADENLKKYGKNQLSPPKTTPEWIKFLKTLFGGFAGLLWIGGLLCVGAFTVEYTQDPEDVSYDYAALGGVLIGVVILTGIFAYYQESKSAAIMASFNKLVPHNAFVYRDGEKKEIATVELTLGDIIEMQGGDRIPADVRILEAKGFKVDNSSLTGESEPQSRIPERK